MERDFEAAMKNLSGIVENPDMYPYLTGYDNLMIQARACGVGAKQVDEAVRMVGMQMRIKEKFKTYSLGMKQRLGIAQALLHQPKIMILDEPTNGLDPAGIQEMRNLLRHLAHNAGFLCWYPATFCRKCSLCAILWVSSATAPCCRWRMWKS